MIYLIPVGNFHVSLYALLYRMGPREYGVKSLVKKHRNLQMQSLHDKTYLTLLQTPA